MTSAVDVFRDAQTLAQFSNISTSDEADYFRHNYSGFLPETWWDRFDKWWDSDTSRPRPYIWLEIQRLVREAWQRGFPMDACIHLISIPARFEYLNLLKLVQSGPLPFDRGENVWPYQRAVMVLSLESWRVRVCVCGNRFAADKPQRRFCSDRCAATARKGSRLIWWKEHGKQWRSTRPKVVRTKSGKAKKNRGRRSK